MKITLLLVGILPVAALANAIRQKESPAPKATAKVELRTAKQRWENAGKAEAPSFRRHVIPLMSRAGCSGRECHGSFSGQGGFQLSLFGYDFEKDHEAITKDKGGAEEIRVDLKEPAKSLVLAKPSLDGEEHKGKKRIEKGSWEYNLILRWIQDGAKSDVAQTGDFGRLEVVPKELLFEKTGDAIQVKVLAHWKDGTVEDVTQLTRFRTNDESVALVSDTGLVSCKETGDTHVVAFYDNGVHPIPAMLPVSEFTGSRFPNVRTPTKVDELVVVKLRKTGIVPSEVCTDAEFLRRVSLDVAGTLPTPDAVTRFLADQSPGKRAAKIDELLQTPAYAAWWTTKLCDYSGNNRNQLANSGIINYERAFARQWYDWILKRVERNEPYDKLAAGIILANGRSKPDQTYKEYALEMASYLRKENPADFTQRETMPHFWERQNLAKPEEKSLGFAHTFLGVRIECAQCHKHPFDQWTKTDFVQFQAFFEPVSFGGRPDPKDEGITFESVDRQLRQQYATDDIAKSLRMRVDEVRRRIEAGEIIPVREIFIRDVQQKSPVGNRKRNNQDYSSRVLTPKILGGEEVLLTQYPDPREPLMEWLRDKENPYFARAFVNRVWASYFNRGIVEPADDMNLANPPVNKDLMDYLADGFIAHGFDMKWVHREILNSDTYQRSCQPTASNRRDEKNFSHAVIRRLPAEVMLDAITLATAAHHSQKVFSSEFEARSIGPNAGGFHVGRRVGDEYALSLFGKPPRQVACDCERTAETTLLQTIYARFDDNIRERIESTRPEWPSWITELRLAYGRGNARRDDLERMAASLDQQIKSMRPPAKPTDTSAEAQSGYEAETTKFMLMFDQAKRRKAGFEAAAATRRAMPEPDPEKLATEVFLRTVSRPPTADELQMARADIAAAPDPIDGVRELMWAMLNTREFMVNH